MGPKYGEEKSRLFLQADIFCFPTYYPPEAFPLVLLEAMQFGKPVVSTYEGAIPEIVDEGVTGFLVPPKDFHALSEKLEILIADSELRERMGKAGRMKFFEKYTVDIFERNLLKVFEEVADGIR